MDNFDLETAMALLPKMTGNENVTNSLIDSIEYYSEMLNERSQQLLINFVLKTRLTSVAKFYLKSNYDSVNNLLYDMKQLLLPKKSAVAIQTKLFNCRQGNRSIESFGRELENLFFDLTLAQSENDRAKFDILRPINEKMAIRRFAQGLNNEHISLIIIAREYTYLKDAIQFALDENIMLSYNKQYRYKSSNDNFSLYKKQSFSRKYLDKSYNYDSLYSNSSISQRPVSDCRIPGETHVLRDHQNRTVTEDLCSFKYDYNISVMSCNEDRNTKYEINDDEVMSFYDNTSINETECISKSCDNNTDEKCLSSNCEFEKENILSLENESTLSLEEEENMSNLNSDDALEYIDVSSNVTCKNRIIIKRRENVIDGNNFVMYNTEENNRNCENENGQIINRFENMVLDERFDRRSVGIT